MEGTSQFNEVLIKNFYEKSDEGHFIEVDVQIFWAYMTSIKWTSQWFTIWKLKIKKVKKLVANLYDKSEYLIHIRNLKQALSHRLFLKNVQRVIKFNQNVW